MCESTGLCFLGRFVYIFFSKEDGEKISRDIFRSMMLFRRKNSRRNNAHPTESLYVIMKKKKVKVSLYDPLMSVNLFIFAFDLHSFVYCINAHVIVKQIG